MTLLFKFLGLEKDGVSNETEIDTAEIAEQLEANVEEKLHFGIVSHVQSDHSLVDGELWMSGSAVCRVTGRRPECGDRVEVRLVKSLVGATNWRVEEVLRVQPNTVQDDKDERSSGDECGPDLSHNKLSSVTGRQCEAAPRLASLLLHHNSIRQAWQLSCRHR